MAYTNIGADGAIAYNITQAVKHAQNADIITMLSGEKFYAPAHCGISSGRWVAFRFHKTNAALQVPGIIDLMPYSIDWIIDLDQHTAQGLGHMLATMNLRTKELVSWRNTLSQSEHDALISGTFTAISGASTGISGAAFVLDLLTGGLPVFSGLSFLGSAMFFSNSASNLEIAAKQGDNCVRQINRINRELVDMGKSLDLPYHTPHYTPVIVSATTTLAAAFGVKDQIIHSSQHALDNWLSADLRFAA